MREDQPVIAARQQGMSLVELMVAITIGLVLAIVATNAYMSASTAQSSQTDLTRIQESARFTFDLVAREARLAGYRNNTAPGAAWLSFDTAVAANSYITGGNDATTVTVAGATTAVLNASDVITFRYYGHDNSAVPPTAADDSILNCQGTSIRRDQLLSETLFVAADATNNNEPTLYCGTVLTNTAGTVLSQAQVPLIPGVESLQILYGEDTDGDGVINRYVPIGSITDLGGIKAIWVSAVIRSPGNSLPAPQTQVFNHFGVTYAPGNTAPAGDAGSVFTGPSDSRARRVISTVAALRNNL
jgi:type IV pilus assembly protein PilW